MQVNPLKSFLQLSSSEVQTPEVWSCNDAGTTTTEPSSPAATSFYLKHKPKDANSDKLKRCLEPISHIHIDILH